MDLPELTDLDVSEKRVLVRLDLDTEPDSNDLRIKASEETLDYLKNAGAQIIILAHKGRPNGVQDDSLSLRPFQNIFDKWGAKVEENLRFDPGEEKNDPEFAKKLASLGEVYVNEAFAVSHRSHASIVGIPKFLPHAAGMRFEKEIEMLSRVIENPQRPLIFLISGIKKDKLEMIVDIKSSADKILVGGRLPEFLSTSEESVPATSEVLRGDSSDGESRKVLFADLNSDKEDITIHSIERFEKEIEKAKTIVLAGVIGKVEDEGHQLGTRRVFTAVANSDAYKVAGGGDTEAALTKFGLTDKFSWISVGGGAMLEFLAKKTLPGIEVLLH